MSTTRDPEFPAEMAQLMAAFNRCADGHEPLIVLNASIQMLAAAIGVVTRSKNASLAQTVAYANIVVNCVLNSVELNYGREAMPLDVVVRPV